MSKYTCLICETTESINEYDFHSELFEISFIEDWMGIEEINQLKCKKCGYTSFYTSFKTYRKDFINYISAISNKIKSILKFNGGK
jgi:hypothetical protein